MSAHGGPMGGPWGPIRVAVGAPDAKLGQNSNPIKSDPMGPFPALQIYLFILFFVYNSRSTTYGGCYVKLSKKQHVCEYFMRNQPISVHTSPYVLIWLQDDSSAPDYKTSTRLLDKHPTTRQASDYQTSTQNTSPTHEKYMYSNRMHVL